MSTSTFTQILSSGFDMLECCFTSTETVGLLGTGAQDGHLDFHTAPELCDVASNSVVLTVGVIKSTYKCSTVQYKRLLSVKVHTQKFLRGRGCVTVTHN